MRLKEIVLLVALLSIAPFAIAGYGSESPRLEKLYGTFISPCCWRENLNIARFPSSQGITRADRNHGAVGPF